jgi:hypothetical protein
VLPALPDNSRAGRGPSIPLAPRPVALRLAADPAAQEEGPDSANVPDLELRAPALVDLLAPEREAHPRLRLGVRNAHRREDEAADSSSIPKPKKAR